MKFGKEFKKQKVPEWIEAYVNYNGLKRVLQELREFKQSKGPSTPATTSQQKSSSLRPFSGLVRKSFDETKEDDIENQVIAVETVHKDDNTEEYNTNFLMPPQEGGQSEITFFKRLDEELNKVNTFYRDKVEEVIEEAASLNKQMNALIALRIKVEQPSDTSDSRSQRNVSNDSSSTGSPEVNSPSRIDPSENRHTDSNVNDDRTINHGQDPLDILDRVRMNNTLEDPMSTIRSVLNDSKDKDLRFKKAELEEAEGRLKVVFVEFYRKLHLLKHYSYVNLLAFSKILKKYEKVAERRAARSYMKTVDDSYIGSCDEVSTCEISFSIMRDQELCSQITGHTVLQQFYILAHYGSKHCNPTRNKRGAFFGSVQCFLYHCSSYTILASILTVAAICFNLYWDIVMDWGLLQRNSKNRFLRDKLSVSRRSVYFVVMVLDVILRLAWLQLVLKFNIRALKGTAISSLFSCLEIFDVGLENEHLNNVGKYRAFKSVPLPFSYYEEDDDKDD
ncbi:phosphate transporter PHO1 homolog 10 isoform X1 [Tanacetum coccineum]